jgi:anthranilate phosphoribosyltransferase
VRRQLVGTFNKDVASKLASVLLRLDARKVLTVHSSDGMDEISIAAPTTAYVGETGVGVVERTIAPQDFGLSNGSAGDMIGGTAEQNAAIARNVLAGEKAKARNVVLANAAAAIFVAGKSRTLADAAGWAAESIDSGSAARSLSRLVDLSNRA